MKADLHIHSNMSDSTLSVDDIITQAKRGGVELFSITDHDTVRCQNEFKEKASQAGISYVKGIEITAFRG